MKFEVLGRHPSPTGSQAWTPGHRSPAASSTGVDRQKREEENTGGGAQYAPNTEIVFKLASKAANPRQAETETRLGVGRGARRARNSEFKPQRLQGGQS